MEALLLKILEGQEKTDRKLDAIEGRINRMQGDINNIQGDINNIQGVINHIQEDILIMKSDIKSLKATVSRIEVNQEKSIMTILKHIKKTVDNNGRRPLNTNIK